MNWILSLHHLRLTNLTYSRDRRNIRRSSGRPRGEWLIESIKKFGLIGRSFLVYNMLINLNIHSKLRDNHAELSVPTGDNNELKKRGLLYLIMKVGESINQTIREPTPTPLFSTTPQWKVATWNLWSFKIRADINRRFVLFAVSFQSMSHKNK